MIAAISNLYRTVFVGLERSLDSWFLGLLARLVFAAVLFVYFFNSALTKVGDGIAGFFTIDAGAYFQILPSVIEQYGFDPSQVPLFPYGLIVIFGTYSEFILPVLIVIGLFTRIAALGMIGFVLVQSYVDINFHHADAATIGSFFDNLSNAPILDQRALWIFLLTYLVVKGPGLLSLDAFLGSRSGETDLAQGKSYAA